MSKKIYFLIFLVISIFLLDANESFGQNTGRKRQLKRKNRQMSSFTGQATKFSKMKMYNGVGINISSMNYFGDITPLSKESSTDLQFSRPQIGITAQRRIGTRYTVRGSFSWGRLAGDDFSSASPTDNNAKFRYVRNLHFRNDIKEIAVVSVVDLFENRGNMLRRVNFTPYVFGGVAVFHHNPKAKGPVGTEWEDEWVPLQPLGTEGQGMEGFKSKYQRFQISIPFGIGIRYRLNNELDLGFEVGYRYTFTDYLDDVSGNFVEPSQFSNDQSRMFSDRSLEVIAARTGESRDLGVIQAVTDGRGGYSDYAAGSKRGTPNKDLYVVTGFHITYVFVGTGKRNAKFR